MLNLVNEKIKMAATSYDTVRRLELLKSPQSLPNTLFPWSGQYLVMTY